MIKIVIDPTGGGTQLGHQSFDKYAHIVEKDYVLSLSRLQQDLLKRHHYDAVLTRYSDVDVSYFERLAQTKGVDLLISNHLNAGRKRGIEIRYAKHHDKVFANNLKHAFEDFGYMVRSCCKLEKPAENVQAYEPLIENSLAKSNVLVYYGYVDGPDYKTLIVGEREYAYALLHAIEKTFKTA